MNYISDLTFNIFVYHIKSRKAMQNNKTIDKYADMKPILGEDKYNDIDGKKYKLTAV
jgi:hypothetical protein